MAQDEAPEKFSLKDPFAFVDRVNKKATHLEDKLSDQTARYLSKLARQEEKLRKKLYKKDSTAAKQLFENSQTYAQLKAQLEKGESKAGNGEYMPGLDSLKTTLQFLNKEQLLNASPELQKQYQQALGKLDGVKGEFNQAANVESFIQQRQQLLKNQLQNLGMVKQLKQMQKQAYYYRQQVEEYKQLLNDPSKLEAKALELARRIPAFTDFFNKHSELASLFGQPGGTGTDDAAAAVIPGLQTRAAVQQELQQRFGAIPDMSAAASGAGGASNPLQQNINAAQQQISQLKDKLKSGFGNTDDAINQPDFKPNSQHTKTLWQRLEPGISMQSQGASKWLPSTSDIALTLGYKLNDKSVIGIGAAYKLGWGKPLKEVHLTHEGFGLRSYLDWRIKGNWWLSGGWEYNYQQSFVKLQDLHSNVDIWQKSALLGITKKVAIGKKTNNVQLLYDFLWKQQTPNGQAIKFRVGVGL